ncbi:MAG TPA: site-2 protease family protein [Clostridia bacterium]|nr:site-2 protease family protein [Clostridia bacterium]
MNIFNRSPEQILYSLPGILIAIVFHEFAHGIVSDKLGDPTPRNTGRLTLSPLPHIDIIGFILMVLVGFGWAKPVQINPSYYKKPRRDEILVSIAGPLMNILLAFVFLGFIKALFVFGANLSNNMFEIILTLLFATMYLNIMLFIFNIIPIYPLDGSHVLSNILGYRNYNIVNFLNRYGFIILIVLIISPLSYYIIGYPTTAIVRWMCKIASLPRLA